MVAAHIVAGKLRLPDLTASANSAYVHGMDTAMVVCGIAALAAALLVAGLLPNPERAEDGAGSAAGPDGPDGADGAGGAGGLDAGVRTVAPLPVDGRQ